MGKKLLLVFLVMGLVCGGVGGAYWAATIHLRHAFREANDLLNQGQLQQAAALFEKVYRKRPGSTEGFDSLAALCQLMFSLDQKDKILEYAREFYRRSIDPENKARARYYLGFALYAQGNSHEALGELTAAVQENPSSTVADDSLLLMAKVKTAEGKLLDARELYKQIIESYPSSNLLDEVYFEYGKVNVALLFSPIPTPESEQYTIVSGDTVERIAKKFNTTAEVIRGANRLTGDVIRKGQTLKVERSEYVLVINKSRNTLTLSRNGELFKIYFVGTGRANSTPVGDYKITNKLVNPTWYKPEGGVLPFGDEGNLLGTRWMGINLPGYGIHGTWAPETIGKQSSAGCVRLLNEEVEELFQIVDVGTSVKIVD